MKSKIAAGLLAFFLGPLGIHRFYLGQTGLGIAYLIFCWFPVTWLIAFIDFIVFLTMDEDVFNAKYNKGLMPKYNQNQQQQRQYNTSYEDRPTHNNYKPEYERPKYERPKPKQEDRPTTNRFKNEGTRLYREYDFKGAIKSYQQSLRIEPKDAIVHFNLACLYSLMEEPHHAYMHLSKAVEYGFVMYDKIREHDHLAYLRTQNDFEAFVARGYKLKGETSKNETPKLPPRQKDEINLMSDEIIRKLEKLGDLRDKRYFDRSRISKTKRKITQTLVF